MLKALNLTAPIDDATAAYVKASGTNALLLWTPRWIKWEPEPGQYDDSLWEVTDAQVARAHELNVRVFLTVDSAVPPWAYRRQIRGRKPPEGRDWRMAPDDRTAEGPWARYVGAILRRHPHVEGIAVMNEPNAGFVDQPSMARATTELIRAAADVWRNERATPMLMVPATFSGGGSVEFTRQVLTRLAVHPFWHRHVRVAWAHHHYADVVAGQMHEVRRVLAALRMYRWPGDEVWLTEGGYRFPTHQDANPDYHADPATWHYDEPLAEHEARQASHVEQHFDWCRVSRRVRMWANYECVDSLWGGWASGLFRHDGTPHPAADVWSRLHPRLPEARA